MSGRATAEENGAVASEIIRVSPEMKGWLDSLRLAPRESYDHILRNLRETIAPRRAKKNGA